ncbi:IS1595 family transposase [Glaciihabitans sp. UYNi722]|uniref:IS1595 family transposase n=1 Tax=Glaciihabitans sp. UYNi722 TaxID=3156344 RepID=UPI003394F69D
MGIVPIMLEAPVEGRDFPGSLPELRAWFRSDADCVDYLDWLRWPDGFVCPWCADVGDWSATASIYRCNGCRRRVSVTSQTVFHRTRTPLTVWFEAAWLKMVSKQGLSALNLQRVTDLGSYQTAWTMTHKLRTVMSQSGRKRLTGQIEIDETYVGGAGKPGLTGRGAAGKTLVAGAVERRGRGMGRARLQVIADASSASLEIFLRDHVTLGATVITDAWRSYPAATAAAGVAHEVRNVSASVQPAHVSLPGVHRLFSLSKRVLEGTYQGSVQPEHLQAYLDEFVFRFNRRNSHTRGMLFLRLLESAVAGHPAPYTDLAVIHRKPRLVPVPPQAPHALPRTLTGPPLKRPWRSARAAQSWQLHG